MNASAAMPARKSTLILLVVLASLAVWIPQQRKLDRARLAVAEAEMRRVKIEERATEATATLESARRELRTQQAIRIETLVAVAKVEEELARIDPEFVGSPRRPSCRNGT